MGNKFDGCLDDVNLREVIPKEIERHKRIAENLERFLEFLERDHSNFIRKEVQNG